MSIPNLVVSIYHGNHCVSKLGGHKNPHITTRDDYEIVLKDDRRFGFRVQQSKQTRVNKIDVPVKFNGKAKEISWKDLDDLVKVALFNEIFPYGTKEEQNLFVYGPVLGAEKNHINNWVKTHKVYNREITLKLREELGEFSEVRVIKPSGREAKEDLQTFVYMIDESWMVTVYKNPLAHGEVYESYKIEDFTKFIASQKAFDRRIARLAKAANVPWEIAEFARNIDSDDEAIKVLKAVKAVRGTLSTELRKALSEKTENRVSTIKLLLGNTWWRLSCKGQQQIKTLANYLLGKK